MPDEIIIADDGSGDDTKALIDEYRGKLTTPLLHVWHKDEGFRKTIILNKAIGLSSSDYIIQVDGDVILDKYFVGDHKSVAEKNCFIRGTRAHLLPHKTAEVLESKQIDLSFLSPGIKHRNNAVRLPLLAPLVIKKKMSSNSVRGSNLSFWKKNFEAVNGYNNDLSGWGHEDEELAARFINIGVRKKKVKLRCIQYHLYHRTSSLAEEPFHRKTVDEVVSKRIMRCNNGLQESMNYEN